MTDPLDRDLFPNRPKHPDFWRLSEIVLQNDGASIEGRVPLDEQMSQYIDPESLVYVAEQRAAMACQMMGLPATFGPMLGACFIDGVVTGIKFEQRREI